MQLLYVKQLAKSFPPMKVFSQIQFDLSEGEILLICGPNGSGKTTLLKVLRGVLQEDQGGVTIHFKPASLRQRLRDHRINLVLPSEQGFFERLSLRENLYAYCSLLGVKKGERKARLKSIIEDFELEPLLEKSFGQCSRGEKQFMHLAANFLSTSTLLYLFDEPLNFLDEGRINIFKRNLQKTCSERGAAAIVALQSSLRSCFAGVNCIDMERQP